MITIRQLSKEYFELIDQLQSDSTIKRKKSIYNNHIVPNFGDSDLNTINFVQYQKFVNNLLSQGLKPKTVKNIKDLLQAFYKMAIKLEYTDKNPLLDVELPRYDNKRHFNYSTEVQKEFIKTIVNFDEPIYSDMFFFLLHGRRLNEVLSLEWEMVDMVQRIYYIPARINKAKKNQSHNMTDQLFARLQTLQFDALEEQETAFLSGIIFKNPRTDKAYVDISKAWKRLLKSGNLPHIRIHDIRHLIGTYSINFLELPIEKVSHTLGHSSIEVTQKYVTPSPENSKYVTEILLNSIDNYPENIILIDDAEIPFLDEDIESMS
jgi:integrase